MVLLIHHPSSQYSRKIRLQMSEKKMLFVLREEDPWKLSEDFLKLNPAGELPVFLNDGKIISGNYAICEYLEETHPDIPLVFGDADQKAEIRRLCDWFDYKFTKDVYKSVVNEKVYKRFAFGLAPDSRILKSGLNNLSYHLEYIEWLLDRRQYLAADTISLADLSAAAQLSILDYLGCVPWEDFKSEKIWYSKMKSRPSFKEVLKDSIKGILPAKHYANLDF